jgi:hypothetical protein
MTIYKAPFDQFSVSFDFAVEVKAGNSVASIASITATSDLTKLDSTAEVIASSPAPEISATVVTFWVQGGVVGETHTIAVQIISSIGERHQGDITLRIVE